MKLYHCLGILLIQHKFNITFCIDCYRINLNSYVSTRLHPQGKGGPQVILCERRLNLCQKSENIPTEWTPKSSIFDRSSIYQSRTFDRKKCVFDRFLGERRRYVFAKLTGPVFSTDRGCLDCVTQKVCTGCCCTVAKRPKICSAPSAPDALRTHKFKRRPHKMPFGQRFLHNM